MAEERKPIPLAKALLDLAALINSVDDWNLAISKMQEYISTVEDEGVKASLEAMIEKLSVDYHKDTKATPISFAQFLRLMATGVQLLSGAPSEGHTFAVVLVY